MSGTLRVLWTVSNSSTVNPRPILRCSRCDAPRPFESSGKFRLNANGKRLDAWLVYRCATCRDTWNRPVFDRRPRGEIPATVLEALQRNDPAYADAVARDIAGIARWAPRLDGQAETPPAIDKRLLDGDPAAATALDITVVGAARSPRGDRLLALGFGISRARLSALVAAGRIDISGPAQKTLTRPLGNGAVVTLDLSGLEDASRLASAAVGD